MPVRSNIFQRLVAEIHRDLGPGWRVKESRLLNDSVTGEQREVDVVAEAVVGGYPLLISIEVRDRSRPADVTWVEGLAKKHEHLPTSKLVLWSPSGFSGGALAKAKALNIETVTPGAGPGAPFASIARDLIGSSVKFVRPRFEASADVTLGDGSAERWAAPPGMVLREENGKRQARVGAILQQITANPTVHTTLLDHAPEGAGNFYATYMPPVPCVVTGPGGVVGRLIRVGVGITTECEVAPVVARSALHNGTVTTLAEASLSDGTLQVVVRELEGKDASMTPRHQRGVKDESRPRARRRAATAARPGRGKSGQ
jgi:hypothetical protein